MCNKGHLTCKQVQLLKSFFLYHFESLTQECLLFSLSSIQHRKGFPSSIWQCLIYLTRATIWPGSTFSFCGQNSKPLTWQAHIPHHRGNNWHEQGREPSWWQHSFSERNRGALFSSHIPPRLTLNLWPTNTLWHGLANFSITPFLQRSLKQRHQNHLVHSDLCFSLVKFHLTDVGPSQSQGYFWISSLSLAIIHLHSHH